MRRMRLIFLAVLCALAFTPLEAGAFLWVECMFAANVRNITISADEDDLKASLELDIKIVTMRRGTANSGGSCGFRKGDTIEIKNFSDVPGERKTFIGNSFDIKRIKSGDHVTILYGLLDNEKGKQEIWEFLRVKSIPKK